MILAPKPNFDPQSFFEWSLSERPLNLKEALLLRDGLELPRTTLPGFVAQKTHPNQKFNEWVVINSN